MTETSEHLARLLAEKESLLTIGTELHALAVAAQDSISAQVLDDFLERFRRTRFLVLVVGDFKAGKSTLVNALLGRRLCPVKATPKTAKVTRVSATVEPKGKELVDITYLKDQPNEKVALSDAALDDLVAVKGRKTDSIQMVDVFINPGESLLRFPVRLVDTPGLGSSEKGHSAITNDYVRNADVLLFVFSASKPLSEAERAFLLLNRPLLDRMIFVVNQMDRVSGEEEDVLEYLREGLQREILPEGATPILHPVSGSLALGSEREESGVPKLIVEIERHLAAKPIANLLATIGQQQQQVCSALQNQLQLSDAAIDTANQSSNELRPALAALRGELLASGNPQAIRTRAAAEVAQVQDGILGLSSRLRKEVLSRCKAWVDRCTSEGECRQGLPAFLAHDLTNAVQLLDAAFTSETSRISASTLSLCAELFQSLEDKTRVVLAPRMAVRVSRGEVGRGVAALSGMATFAEQMGTPQGGYGVASKAVAAALGPSSEVRLLSLGAAVSFIVAALGGPVSWLFAGAASLVATFFGLTYSTGWRRRVLDRVTDRLDEEILPSLEAALRENLESFAATLDSEVVSRTTSVRERLLGIVGAVALDLEAAGNENLARRGRLRELLGKLDKVAASLAKANRYPTEEFSS